MATVADLSGNGPTDKSFVQWSRRNGGSPNASLTPQFWGEIVLDTTNHTLWKAEGLTNADWIALAPF